MAESNDGAIASALQAVTQDVENNQQGGNDEFYNLAKFQRNNRLPSKFGMHMLTEEVDDWWEYVRCKKEIEFLKLKQGNSIVVEYAVKFEELVKLCPHYNDTAAEVSKCIKFKNGLRPEIKQGIGYRQILRFPELVKKCRIYDKDNKARSAHYKSLSEKMGKQLDHGKSYIILADKGK
ncbi:uncharacterized protein LOC127103436 [Lathyrus oleraceus]|uniref:uncharacterized protein LOC127103436 n=1 Tax=Pisum sativum TaxID=3888 RepID=UPI0021CF6A47|nr:uncharacterized protein LOC127103436 [Pisum sativum]